MNDFRTAENRNRMSVEDEDVHLGLNEIVFSPSTKNGKANVSLLIDGRRFNFCWTLSASGMKKLFSFCEAPFETID